MISSFRLPDLVLGVSIRADVRGAKQAARDLKNAVGRELGTTGGGSGGGGGGGFGGGLLGGVLGAGMLGGGIKGKVPRANFKGGLGFKKRPGIKGYGGKTLTSSDLIQLLAMKELGFSSVELREVEKVLGSSSLSSTAGKSITPFNAGKLAWRNKAKISGKRLAEGLHSLGIKEIATPYFSALGLGLVGGAVGSGIEKKAGAAAGIGKRSKFSPRMFSRIGRMAGLGGLGGIGATMMMVVRFLGPLGFALIAAALAFKMAMSFVVSSLTTAVSWIRRMGIHHGEFGNFSAQIDNFTVVWRNLKLEFGLFLIQVFQLGAILQNIVPIFASVAQAINVLANNKIFRAYMRLAMAIIPSGYVFNPQVWKGANNLLGVPNTGNERIGRGTALNMSPAALEGSAEASRIVNSAVMAYQAETARNTKRCAETLQQILNRAPELGVVPG